MPHRHHRQPRRRPWPGLRLHHLRPGRPVPGVDRPDARNVLRGLR